MPRATSTPYRGGAASSSTKTTPRTPQSTRTRSAPYMYTPGSARTAGRPMATPNGLWMTKTAACKHYKLKPADLAAISPVAETRNPRGGPYNVQHFNQRDVSALAEQKHGHFIEPPANFRGGNYDGELAEKRGAAILRSKAMTVYKLKGKHLDRIKPVSIMPNPHRPSSTMRYYNKCDVEALAAQVQDSCSPTSSPARKEGPNNGPARAADIFDLTGELYVFDDEVDEMLNADNSPTRNKTKGSGRARSIQRYPNLDDDDDDDDEVEVFSGDESSPANINNERKKRNRSSQMGSSDDVEVNEVIEVF